MCQITIRPAHTHDAAAIVEVHAQAFGRADEARLVETIAVSDAFIPELSLVAEAEGAIVGHILLSRIRVGAAPALALAPLAVRQAWQRRGIGQRLTHESLRQAAARGHAVVVVLGHPRLYAACGFVPARPLGIKPPFEIRDDEAWRAIELTPGALTKVRGVVEYPPPWGVVL